MLTYEAALKRVLAHTSSPVAANTAVKDALGLVLAEPVVSPLDLPGFDNSAMDGYAIRAQDFSAGSGTDLAPWMLRVVGHAHAGTPFPRRLRTGEAVRILTGAQVPRGANAVIMQEQAVRKNDWLFIEHPPKPGQHIRRQGEDLRRGMRVLEPGTCLRPQELGLLAALGRRTVRVYRRPTVAILTTGDELRRPGSRLQPGCIYESNGTLVQALVQRSGGLAKRLGLVRDAGTALRAAIQRGLLAADVLVMTGGVSVGDKDFVRQAARHAGIRQLFWKVDIKPGMPLFVGRHRPACRAGRGAGRRTLVFGLPGNPVSVFVTFEEFVKPALYRLLGREWKDSYTAPAALAADLRVSATRRTQFIRVSCTGENGSTRVAPLDGQGSHHLRSLVEADGWIRVLSDGRVQPAGTAVSLKRSES